MIQKTKRKSLNIKYSGRSSDYISPSFGFGCLLNCSYCYMKRHKHEGLSIATNIDEILIAINDHCKYEANITKPNQTDKEFITYDISCNEDFALHSKKYYDWKKIFQFFVDHPKAKATLATKIIPKHFLEFNPKNKVRIRFSIMPEKLREVLEPNTPLIENRLKAVKEFIALGYDVHLNFSPVIVYDNWLQDYRELFILVNNLIPEYYKKWVQCEVIFLTHNKIKHLRNLEHNIKGEHLLWNPNMQEDKISQYGSENIRYKWQFKAKWIQEFKILHTSNINWCDIRYIF